MRLAVLLALTSVAAADPLATQGDGSFDVGVGPAAFVTDYQGTSVDPALAMRVAVGRFTRDDLALSIVFSDTAYLHASASTTKLDNALTFGLGAQWWVRRELFLEAGFGLTEASNARAITDTVETDYAFLGRAGWALPLRHGTAATLSLALTHTWLDGSGSTNSIGALVGYQFL